jgi:hypothetical protein
MADNIYRITLTDKGVGSGPQYTLFYDTGSSGAYTPVLGVNPVTLPDVGDSIDFIADQQATSFKLSDYPGGPCDTCSTSSIAVVPAPLPPTQLCFCYYAQNLTSGSVTVNYTNCANNVTSSIISSGSVDFVCARSGSTPSGTGLLVVSCGSSCSETIQCLNCGFIPPTPTPTPTPIPLINGFTIAQCTGSTKYNITFNTTSSITVGTVVSGSDFAGCYFVSSSFTGSVGSFNYISSSLYNVYSTCFECAYLPPPYTWYASSNYATAFDACIGQAPNQILYSNSSSLINTQTFMYTDPGLTTPYNGLFNSYSRIGVSGDGSWAAAETDATGMITGVTPC